MGKEEILQKAKKCVLDYDQEDAKKVASQAVKAGLDPMEVITEGLSEGMREVGDLFDRGEIFLPEVIMASEAMLAAVEILEGHLPKKEQGGKAGVVVLGTVEGDVHDIGKGIVATLLRVYGFNVHDLGRDVPIESFVAKAKEVNANIIGSSAMMTTTMTGQKRLEQELANAGLRDKVRTMVGGAVVTQRWTDKIGADAYAENAQEAVVKARELVS